MRKGKAIPVATVAAVLVEGVLFSVASHQHASHSPGLLFLFHLPGIMLTVWTDMPDPAAQVVIAFTGALQVFVIVLLGLIIWTRIYGRRDS